MVLLLLKFQAVFIIIKEMRIILVDFRLYVGIHIQNTYILLLMM